MILITISSNHRSPKDWEHSEGGELARHSFFNISGEMLLQLRSKTFLENILSRFHAPLNPGVPFSYAVRSLPFTFPFSH